MSNPVPDTQPDPDEVLQHEVETAQRIAPVPVVVEGPIRAQLPPATSWAAFSIGLTNAEPILVLSRNPMRKRAVFISNGGATWLGGQASRVRDDGFRLPDSADGFSLEITHSGEVWAESDGASSILRVSDEYWTD
jgi:hypothetical protein